MFNRPPDNQPDYETQRHQMVEKQLARRGIVDPRVLDAMRNIPRHEFVAEEHRDQAYADYPLPIGYNQTISQPFIVASMTQELRLSPACRVLEIGTGCGYQTAVLAEIVEHVYSIEVIPDLYEDSRARLQSLGYRNVTLKGGDGSLGWFEEAPFDAILVAAAAGELPTALPAQLTDSGRLIIPLVSADGHNQDLVLFQRTVQGLTRKALYGVRFVPLCTGE